MKNFRIKNIVLLLAVCLGTTAAYSASRGHHQDRDCDVLEDVLSCKSKPAPITKPTPKPTVCVEEQECFVPNQCEWRLVIAEGRARYTSGPLMVTMSECGKVEVDGIGCISRQMNKEIVQAVQLGKILFAANCKFNAHFLGNLLAAYEECPCPDRKPAKSCK